MPKPTTNAKRVRQGRETELFEVIDSIRDALKKECWIPALALALTLPDVCGSIAYPDMVNNRGRRLSKKQYMTWFKDYVEHRFADHTGFDESGKALHAYFNADMCYQLRCEVLHASNDDVRFEHGDIAPGCKYDYCFELMVNACNSYGEIYTDPYDGKVPVHHVHVCVDVLTLCEALCAEASSFLKSVDIDQMEDHQIKIVNVSKVLERCGFNR